MPTTLTKSPTLTAEFLRGACMMELNELLHKTYIKDWGVEVKPHAFMPEWFTVEIWVVILHTEKPWPFDVRPEDDLNSLRNELYWKSEVINQWINE
jgi:hypothetical protein